MKYKAKEELIKAHVEMSELKSKMEFIEAKHTKRIWEDAAYDKYNYNQQQLLRRADFTIALSEDAEYQRILSRRRELYAEFFAVDVAEIELEEPLD